MKAGFMNRASSCLATLLSNNKSLLDQFIDEPIVDRFIQLISDKGPEADSLRFFQAICSCRGSQILSNQELCLQKFYLDGAKRRELVIETCSISPEIVSFIRRKDLSRFGEEGEETKASDGDTAAAAAAAAAGGAAGGDDAEESSLSAPEQHLLDLRSFVLSTDSLEYYRELYATAHPEDAGVRALLGDDWVSSSSERQKA